ncbi:MAG TPA: hypothetical protein VGS80_17835 [Ktedonobacterales bacterium]|nr:hypothetical protein [Ktedonobacterales bacterium]
MHRLLERLDGAASTVVPVAYLAGLALGTMAYFTGVTLNAGLAVGVALALAAELHAFLEQRRCRALWAAYSRSRDEDVREHLSRQLKAHAAILAALVLFSAVNATAFAAETWHPAAGFLPVWLQIGIRGAVVPIFFLLTGALSPLTITASDELATTSRHMLRKTIRAVTKQWNARIERARRTGLDLAPTTVALMLDAGDTDGARRVELIARGLAAAESGLIPGTAVDAVPLGSSSAIVTPAELHAELPPERPPTGPGTPVVHRRVRTARTPNRRAVVRLTPEPAETRIRRIVEADPGASVRTIAARASVGRSTASKWRGIITAEASTSDAGGELQEAAQ